MSYPRAIDVRALSDRELRRRAVSVAHPELSRAADRELRLRAAARARGLRGRT